MEPEEEGSRDEGEDAVRAMERPEAGAACSSPGSSGPEEPDGLAWCKLIGRGGAGRGGRSPGGAAGAGGGGGAARGGGGGGGRWGATVPAPFRSFRFPRTAEIASLCCLVFGGENPQKGWLCLGVGWAQQC